MDPSFTVRPQAANITLGNLREMTSITIDSGSRDGEAL